ncbi:hypothetical protein PPYR_05931 [Photinus pyralis]|uniref:Integrase catalytic domain-containing protein n=1 Tax=Photinus pyralis TaxID=7054 RepID=A0A5N4AS90_PHOPY|nr:hypothetical protein PPYR_05931 [Photinus pyralis]
MSVGEIIVPICVMGRVKLINILVVPDLCTTLILGMDFWVAMDIVPDLKRNEWHFGEPSHIAVSGIDKENVFLLFGAPQYVICDNGVQMRSKEFEKLCKKYSVKISYTPLYYPRADPCERVNRVVKTMISSYVKDDHRKWDENISAIACAIRTASSEATGYSPYFINFGREYVLSGEEFSRRAVRENKSITYDQTMHRRILRKKN